MATAENKIIFSQEKEIATLLGVLKNTDRMPDGSLTQVFVLTDEKTGAGYFANALLQPGEPKSDLIRNSHQE